MCFKTCRISVSIVRAEHYSQLEPPNRFIEIATNSSQQALQTGCWLITIHVLFYFLKIFLFQAIVKNLII